MRTTHSLAITFGLTLWGHVAAAQDAKPWYERTKFSGYMMGDVFWVPSHHSDQIEGLNGFWFRRVYFTMDHQASDAVTVRLRLEAANAGDFKSNNKVTPFLKDAYLGWQLGSHRVLVGLSPSPTWELVETVWGYRSIEKTPLDLQRWGGSRDLGLAVLGSFDRAKRVRYHAMVANGSDTGSETNTGKKALFAVAVTPTSGALIEVYGDIEDRPEEDRSTLQVFGLVKGKPGRFGLQWSRQWRNTNTVDSTLDIASAFGVLRLSPAVYLVVRADRQFDPNPEGSQIPYLPFDNQAKSTLYILALDYLVWSSVNLIPNIEIVRYDRMADGTRPTTDVVPRITLFYRF